jgi:heme exporter protein C
MKRYAVPILLALASIGFVFTLWYVFAETPVQEVPTPDPIAPTSSAMIPDPGQSLYFSQKIFYYHVPNAFMLFLSVFLCGLGSVAYLRTRNARWDDVALSAAETAVMFGAVVLVTGSIWAKAAWDVWWVWEKRLTMSLLLWLTLVGYVMVRRFAGAGSERLAAGLAVFGTVSVPFIYFMVSQGDHHPQAGAGGNVATLSGVMQLTFWMSVLTFLLWFLALSVMRVSTARAERQVRELHERAMDAGLV